VIDSQTLENVYTLKIMNKSSVPQSYTVTATGLKGDMEVVVDGQYLDRISEAGSVLNLPVKVRAKKSDVTKHIQSIKLHIQVNSDNGTVVSEKTKYFGPRHK
jgi:polyferredoxin